jgi:hypothetical protein
VGTAACLALIGAIVLPLNFFFMSGDPLPWINPANAFNEGVSIDLLIPLLALPLLISNLRAVRALDGDLGRAHNPARQRLPWAS